MKLLASRKISFFALLFVAVFLAGAAGAQESVAGAVVHIEKMGSIVGTWKLISMTYEDQATGKQAPLWGEHPIGFLTYTQEGRMSAVISASDRSVADNEPNQISVETQAGYFRSCFAYAGSYTPTKMGVIHHVEVANDPAWVGKDQVRYLHFEGNKLVVTAPATKTVSDPNARVLTLVWERL